MLLSFRQMDSHIMFIKTPYKIEWSWVKLQSSIANSMFSTELLKPINSSNLANIFQAAVVLHLNLEISAFWKILQTAQYPPLTWKKLSEKKWSERNVTSPLLPGILQIFHISYFNIMVGQNHMKKAYILLERLNLVHRWHPKFCL